MTHALIIEDDALSQEVLYRLLDAEGFVSTTVNDPAHVAAMLPDLDDVSIVFLDLEMPHLDGYEVLALLRDHYGESVPVVAYTVHISEINMAMEMGFDSFIGKPVNADRFPAHLHSILNGSPVWVTR
jgi:CheY-like chemotaxis protein